MPEEVIYHLSDLEEDEEEGITFQVQQPLHVEQKPAAPTPVTGIFLPPITSAGGPVTGETLGLAHGALRGPVVATRLPLRHLAGAYTSGSKTVEICSIADVPNFLHFILRACKLNWEEKWIRSISGLRAFCFQGP